MWFSVSIFRFAVVATTTAIKRDIFDSGDGPRRCVSGCHNTLGATGHAGCEIWISGNGFSWKIRNGVPRMLGVWGEIKVDAF